MENTDPRSSFTCKEGADVETFLLTYDNDVIRKRNEEGKATCFFAYLDKDALVEHRERKVYRQMVSENWKPRQRDNATACKSLADH